MATIATYGRTFSYKMHVVFVCGALAICASLQLAVGQCTRPECEGNQRNGENEQNGSSREDCNQQSFLPTWSLGIGKLDVERVAVAMVDWVQNTWKNGAKLKLKMLKNEQNDTSVNISFKDVDPVTNHDEVGRTFGIRKRMHMFLLLPISFKLGIIMTLLLVLTAMSLKTLIIGFVILLLLLHHTHGHAKLWGPKIHEVDTHKNIHIHVHNSPADHRPYVQSWQDPQSQPFVYSA